MNLLSLLTIIALSGAIVGSYAGSSKLGVRGHRAAAEHRPPTPSRTRANGLAAFVGRELTSSGIASPRCAW